MFQEEPLYVIVNEFESYSLKDFTIDCEKVLRTGQRSKKKNGLVTHVGIPYIETKVEVTRTLKL